MMIMIIMMMMMMMMMMMIRRYGAGQLEGKAAPFGRQETNGSALSLNSCSSTPHDDNDDDDDDIMVKCMSDCLSVIFFAYFASPLPSWPKLEYWDTNIYFLTRTHLFKF